MLKLVANVRVMDELTADGINVALPLSSGAIDLIALVQSYDTGRSVDFVPIQIVALREDESSITLDAACASDVITAFVLHSGKKVPTQTFALTAVELTLVRMIDVIDAAGCGKANFDADGQGGARAQYVDRRLHR